MEQLKQIKNTSPLQRNQQTDNAYYYETWYRKLGLLPSTYNFILLKPNLVENRQANKWLKSIESISKDKMTWSRYESTSYVNEVCHLYVSDSTEVFNLF